VQCVSGDVFPLEYITYLKRNLSVRPQPLKISLKLILVFIVRCLQVDQIDDQTPNTTPLSAYQLYDTTKLSTSSSRTKYAYLIGRILMRALY